MKIYLFGTNHPDESIPSMQSFSNKSAAEFAFLSAVRLITSDQVMGEDDLLHLSEEEKSILAEGLFYDENSGAILFLAESELVK